MISVLILTYNNIEGLENCFSSIVKTCSDPDNIEILVRIGNDDPKRKEYLEKLSIDHFDELILSDIPSGYTSLHLFVNELASKARGDWFLLLTDDSIIKTLGWDTIINSSQEDGIYVLNPCGNGLNIFPIVHRKIYDVLGHLSLQCHYDTYIQDLSGLLKCFKRIQTIDIEHKGAVNDHSITSKHYYSKEIQDLLNADAKLIKEKLRLENING